MAFNTVCYIVDAKGWLRLENFVALLHNQGDIMLNGSSGQ